MNFARKAALTTAAVTALALGMIAAETTLAQDKTVMVGGAAMYPSKNIVQNAVNSKDHTTLVTAVKAAGLVETLEGPGPFTVFAPTNEAFAMLPKGTVESLLKPESKEKLVKILTYHVVKADALADGIKKMIKDDGGKHRLSLSQRARSSFSALSQSAHWSLAQVITDLCLV